MIFSFKCTDKYDIFDRYYHFEKTLDTFLTDIHEGYVEESEASDNDSYSLLRNAKRNSSNTELDFEYTQDVD